MFYFSLCFVCKTVLIYGYLEYLFFNANLYFTIFDCAEIDLFFGVKYVFWLSITLKSIKI